ncbi:MAG: hypothetical protein JWN67_3753, partial [Actinomycetia bacterium]|nr:hypothetical protein [Actinomycetes bacterium]
AGPLGGVLKAPIVLTASLPAESQAFLDKYSSRITKLYVSGGTQAIDDATVTAAQTAAQSIANDNPSNTTVTGLPELVSATITKTVTAAEDVPLTNPSGTYVTYTFDEAVFGTTPANFHVYDAAATAYSAATATVQTTPTQVVARFALVNTATLAGGLTVATVAKNAAVDSQGNQNPEGDTGIGVPSTNTTGQAGVTAAPDLTAVGGFRLDASTTGTIVDLTFDQAATVANVTGFHLVRVSGAADITCTGSTLATLPSGSNLPGGSGTTTISVTCPNDSGATPLAAANFQRAYVDAGAVTSATAVPSVMEAQDIGSSSSVLPDLISVAFTQGTTASPNDTAIFTFDQPVSAASFGSLCVYNSTPTATCPGTAATINTVNPAQVLVTYGPTSLDSAVGAQALAGAVTAASSGNPNKPDEVGVANTFATSTTPGTTAAPDLVSVALSKSTDSFGNQLTYQAKYTFDSAATTALTLVGGLQTGFRLYTAAGLELDSSVCTVGSAASSLGNVVTCTAYGAATDANVGASVLGTVIANAVNAGGAGNPEGGAPTTGGTGTAVNP